MSRRRRHSTSSAHGETEVWPAYVDVLSAAFVFVLLAFAALLTRDVAQEDDRNAAHARKVQDDSDFRTKQDEWLRNGAQAVRDAAEGMRDDLKPVGLAGACTLPDATQLSLNPLLVASFSEKQLELDPDHRHPVTLVCTFSENALRFAKGKEEPEPPSKREFVPKLQGLATRSANRRCQAATDRPSWCCAGLEVVGHSDCQPLPDDSKTNWELSTNRADWVLRQMVSDLTVDQLRQREFRLGASGRADREPRVDTSAICADKGNLKRILAGPDSEEKRVVDSTLSQNRRVEVLIFLRTKALEPRPMRPPGMAP